MFPGLAVPVSHLLLCQVDAIQHGAEYLGELLIVVYIYRLSCVFDHFLGRVFSISVCDILHAIGLIDFAGPINI